MIVTRYICDVCEGVISNKDTYVSIRYKIDKSDESIATSSTVELCLECYGKLKKFFNSSKEQEI